MICKKTSTRSGPRCPLADPQRHNGCDTCTRSPKPAQPARAGGPWEPHALGQQAAARRESIPDGHAAHVRRGGIRYTGNLLGHAACPAGYYRYYARVGAAGVVHERGRACANAAFKRKYAERPLASPLIVTGPWGICALWRGAARHRRAVAVVSQWLRSCVSRLWGLRLRCAEHAPMRRTFATASPMVTVTKPCGWEHIRGRPVPQALVNLDQGCSTGCTSASAVQVQRRGQVCCAAQKARPMQPAAPRTRPGCTCTQRWAGGARPGRPEGFAAHSHADSASQAGLLHAARAGVPQRHGRAAPDGDKGQNPRMWRPAWATCWRDQMVNQGELAGEQE